MFIKNLLRQICFHRTKYFESTILKYIRISQRFYPIAFCFLAGWNLDIGNIETSISTMFDVRGSLTSRFCFRGSPFHHYAHAHARAEWLLRMKKGNFKGSSTVFRIFPYEKKYWVKYWNKYW